MSAAAGKGPAPKAEDCVYRLYRPGDEAPLNEMFNEVFHAGRTLAAWRWKYLDDPAGAGCVALGCLPDGRLVAHYSGYPLWLVRNGSGQRARELTFHAGDVMTRPEARAIGIGKTSMLVRTTRVFQDELARRGVPFYFGFNTAVARKFGQMFQGYRDGGKVGYWRLDTALLERLKPARETLLRWQGWRVATEAPQPQALDRFFEEVSPAYGWLVERGRAYLDWRYRARPDRQYATLHLKRRGRLLGWGVFFRQGDTLLWGDGLFAPEVTHRHLVWLLRHAVDLHGGDVSRVEAWFSPHRHGGARCWPWPVSNGWRSRTTCPCN